MRILIFLVFLYGTAISAFAGTKFVTCSYTNEKNITDYTTSTYAKDNKRVLESCGKGDKVCGNHTAYDGGNNEQEYGVDVDISPWDTEYIKVSCGGFSHEPDLIEAHCTSKDISCERDVAKENLNDDPYSVYYYCTNWGTEKRTVTFDTVGCGFYSYEQHFDFKDC